MDSGVEAEHSSLPQREDSQAAAEQITKHLSKETADVGFKFQLEILLLLCLQIFNLECKNFSVGFEVVAIEKLDDIVAECELNGRKFAFFLQAKYKASESEVFLRNFFSPTKKGATRKFWEKFNLRQFVTSLMTRNVQENLKRYSNHVKRYVIVTNNSIEAGDTIQEDCEEFREIFGKFTENGAKVVKFGREFEGKMQEIINVILEESNEVSEESRENSPNALDLLDKIVILSNVPSYSDLAVISNRFSQEIFNSNHSDLLPRFLREETNDFIKLEKNQRKFIHRKDFEDIIEISMLEAELTGISESFFRTLKLPVQFRKDVLEDFYDEMNMQKIIEYEALDQISVIKVYQALKGKQIKIFLLPLSMLKKSHKNFIKHAKCEGFKILLHLDCGKEWSQMVTKDDSVVIIGKIKKLSAIEVDRKFTMKKPLYEEFDDSTKEAIF
uniref:Uncharacterized protein n=1 Tax=Lutzomyia longipalpis TaxID=7200 RepID=A0A1B0CJF8_LUTLO